MTTFALPSPASEHTRTFARSLSSTITLADILHKRGFDDPQRLQRYLHPKLAHLTPPTAMADREVAAERIAFAIQKRERIVVFGDYDCDGMTAAAILTHAIQQLGGQVVPMLASRFAGGYGLSQDALVQIQEASPSLLVTCDCGSSDHDRIETAQRAQIDVVVIDHHLVPTTPLPARAFLNPHRPDCGFPFKGLASCGLALSMVAAIRTQLRKELDLRPYLDLVAIGTIADVAPLTHDNRALVRVGLEVLRAGRRPGIQALLEYANISQEFELGAEDISFRIAPRLNAPGRMGAPNDALRLLLAPTIQEARSAAAACEQANLQRREYQEQIVQEAMAEITARKLDKASAIVLAREGWHFGVVGIVAGRLASEFGVPTIVATISDGVAKGSVRSAKNVPVVTALNECRQLLLTLGGHEKAAGVTFNPVHTLAIQEAFATLSEQRADKDFAPKLHADALLDPHDTPLAVVRDLARLEPCGEANPLPKICLADASVISARQVKGGHLKLELRRGADRLGGFGLFQGSLAPILKNKVHVLGRLRRDTFRGGDAIEIAIEAVVPA
jgi:single-stranded-DNA-specific exonuclease